MVKLKGYFVKTDVGIYDVSGSIGSNFKVVKDKTKTSLVSTTNKEIMFDIVETYGSFEDVVKKNKDIIEIKEPTMPVRYAVVLGVIDDKVSTNEGLVDPLYITALLDYNEWTDSYTRFVFF